MTAKEFAKENGFIGARLIVKGWHGYDCYEAQLTTGKDVDDVPMVGLPQIILYKGGRFRMATFDESMRLIEEVFSDE